MSVAHHAPRFAEPVAHDGHHAGPDGRLQQAVQHPQAAVQVDVVDVEPFGQGAEEELLQMQGLRVGRGEILKALALRFMPLTTMADPHRPKQST